MRTDGIDKIRLKVEKAFGRKIMSSADCLELSDRIFQKTGSRLSFNTLRRFFSLMKAEFNPSPSTLNILAKYCNYASFSDFLTLKQPEPAGFNEQQDIKLLEHLILQFYNIDVSEASDSTYLRVIRQTIIFLSHCYNVLDQLQHKIAKTKNGQIFYFEYFVNIDKLDSFYGDGLKYYLHEKKSRESQLFGHSLLCLRNWLTNNNEGVGRHYEEVVKHRIDATIHPFVCARYFATQLYYTYTFNEANAALLSKARTFYNGLKKDEDRYILLPCFSLNIAEALLLTGENEEALYYIDEALAVYNDHIGTLVDDKAFDSLYLYQALALARLGETAQAKKLFKTIRPEQFYFLSRQYHTILYLLLKELVQKPKADKNQLAHLVKETGFVRLLPGGQIVSSQQSVMGKNGPAA